MIEYKPYSEILQEYQNRKIPYSVKLSANEWKAKREIIIERENNICQVCNNKCMDDILITFSWNFVKKVPATYEEVEIEKEHINVFGITEFTYTDTTIQLVEQSIYCIPHVHHTYYVRNNLPWEYPNEALMLVCHTCHTKIHETEKIKVYLSNSKNELCEVTKCTKCNGAGYIPEYNYWQNGVCFQCGGSCFEEWK
jgi:hypothetical protein